MLTKQDLSQIQKVVREEIKPLKQDVSVLKQDMSTVKKDIVEIRRDIKTVVRFFDREYLELRSRVERIEEHLRLPAVS